MLVVFCANAALAQSSLFSFGGTFPVGAHFVLMGASMVSADFNRDGNTDIATLNNSDGTLTLLLGDGKGGFTPAPSNPISASGSALALATGDFNGDGNPDLALTGGTTTILLGDGKGGFTKGPGIPSGGDLIAVGDFNGDGKLDLVLVGQISALSNVWLGDGKGGFGTPHQLPSFEGNVLSITVGDFDGDGKLDLAVNEGAMYIYAGDGAGNFPKAYELTTGPASTPGGASIVSGDFLGSGKSDLFNGAVTWYWAGAGAFPFNRVTSYLPTVPAFIVTGDFNGDGKLDWAGVNPTFGTVTVEFGDGTGAFTAAPGSPYPVGGSPFALAAGDFNGDGKLDLAADTGSSVVLLLNSVPPSGPAPTISAIVNAASYVSEGIPGGSYVSLFGSNLAASSGDPIVAVNITDPEPNNLFQYPATVLYAGPGQVNIYVPSSLPYLGKGTLQISNRLGQSADVPITFAKVAPGLFTIDASGKIPAAQVLTTGANNTLVYGPVADCSNGACTLVPITLDPATSTYLVLYGTGIRGDSSGVSVTIGGVPATVTYANAQGAFPGLDQLNVLIPQQLSSSKLVNVQLKIGTASANPVQIFIR